LIRERFELIKIRRQLNVNRYRSRLTEIKDVSAMLPESLAAGMEILYGD